MPKKTMTLLDLEFDEFSEKDMMDLLPSRSTPSFEVVWLDGSDEGYRKVLEVEEHARRKV